MNKTLIIIALAILLSGGLFLVNTNLSPETKQSREWDLVWIEPQIE